MLNTNNIDSVLGQKVDSPTTYTPSILVREERQRNRTYLGLKDDKLPFVGYDIWNGYECSCLTDNGLPVTCIAKVVYPATNKYIVESKSMKLYWNGFNMFPMGYTPEIALRNLQKKAETDLSKLLETNVNVWLFPQTIPANTDKHDKASHAWNLAYDPHFLCVLENEYGQNKLFTTFNEDPRLLKASPASPALTGRHAYTSGNYFSTLLRSNCKITHQPDSGDILIRYVSKKILDGESLLEWIVSLRNECHFHEEICEAAYKRLWDLLEPKSLLVTCYYARRGGWDINPTRASHKSLLDKNLINAKELYFKFPRQ